MSSCWFLVWLVCFLGITDIHQAVGDGRIHIDDVYANTTFVEEIQMDPNKYFEFENYYLCLNSDKDEGKYCSCKESCLSYGTCCLDYLWYQKKKWKTIHDYLQFLVSKQSKKYSCQPIVQKYSPSNDDNNSNSNNNNNINNNIINVKLNIEKVIMVSSCPTNNNNNVDSTSSFEILPTFGSDNSVYLNPSTANCHGVNEFTLLPINVSCDNVNQSTSVPNPKFSQCTYRVWVPENLRQYIQTCSAENSCEGLHGSTNKRNAELCKSYTGKVRIKDVLYNNVHCSLCVDNISKIYFGSEAVAPRAITPMPYSAVISYGKGPATAIYDNKGNKVKKALNCKDNEIYDVLRRQCIPFLCSTGYVQNGFECIREGLNSGNFHPSIGLLDDFQTRVEKCTFSTHHERYIVLDTSNSAVDFSAMLKREHATAAVKIISGSKIYNIPLGESNGIEQASRIKQLVKDSKAENDVTALIVSSKMTVTEMYHQQVGHSFPKGRLCFKPVTRKLAELEIDLKCNLKIKNETFPPYDYVMTVDLLNGNKVTVITCKQYHLHDNCRIKKYMNYTLLSNGSISLYQTLHHTEKTLYQVGQYTPMRQGIGVCVKQYVAAGVRTDTKPQWVTDVKLIEGYITMVACLLSTVFYSFTIVVYLRKKELREIPGRNVVCVCIVLMWSDVFVFSTSFVDRGGFLCYVLATVLHFFLLSAHAWSTVISFEIWFTLRKHTSARFIYSPKRFYWYCGYAFMLPLATIVLFSSLDSTKLLPIGYGRSIDYCWIGNLYFKIYLYLVPVALASCFNISVLVFTLHQMHKQQKQSEKLLNKTGDHDEVKIVKTALKLILLLGIVEVVGFIQIPVSFESPTKNRDQQLAIVIFNFIIQFVFTFMRGFRGVFIWVLFVYMDKRAWNSQQCNKASGHSPPDTPTMATKSSRVSYKITNNLVQDTRL